MLKNKFLVLILVLTMALSITGCGQKNPFEGASEEYESGAKVSEFNFDIYFGDNYVEKMNELVEDFPSYTTDIYDSFCDYHKDELDKGSMAKLDVEEYKSEMDSAYEYVYGLIYYDKKNLPEEFNASWDEVVAAAKEFERMLNEGYTLKGEERIALVKECKGNIEKHLNGVSEKFPTVELKVGEPYVKEGEFEITVKNVRMQKTLKQYHRTPDDGNVYVTAKIDFKNTGKEKVDLDDDMDIEVVFDGGYKYDKAYIYKIEGGDLDYGAECIPLVKTSNLLFAEVPESLMTEKTPYTINLFMDGTTYKII